MKIERFKAPTSRFLSVDKDINQLCEMFMDNDRLCRLLYRTDSHPLDAENLTELEKIELLSKKYIRTMPKITVDNQTLNYIIISFDNFVPTSNPEFRDNNIVIDIICHYDQWMIQDGLLRPYRIAGEVDSMLDGSRFSGIGTLSFSKAHQLMVNGEYGGIGLEYLATHGEDDKKHFANPNDEILFLEEMKKGKS